MLLTGKLTYYFMAVEEPFSHFDPFVDDSPQMAKLPEGKISTLFRIIPRKKRVASKQLIPVK